MLRLMHLFYALSVQNSVGHRLSSKSVVVCGLIVLLFLKFFWPLCVYGQPLGYDAGIYRFLFVRYSDAWPLIGHMELPPWAKEHPLGLFLITSPLVQLGIPVAWLLGWVWNVVPIITGGLLALVTANRYPQYGFSVAVGVLIACSLSVAYSDAFSYMYIKTVVALFWMVLSFVALEKRSWLFLPYAFFVIATHHQTGLLFLLVLSSWLALPYLPFAYSTEARFFKHCSRRKIVYGGLTLSMLCTLLFAVYLPVLQDAVLRHIPALLSVENAAPGRFPPLQYYVSTQGILLFFGVAGFIRSFRTERFTVWQLSAMWSAVFIVFRLMFYRRFFVQFDFFMLMYAGLVLGWLWQRYRSVYARSVVVVLLLAQGVSTAIASTRHVPLVDAGTFHRIVGLPGSIEQDATIVALDPYSAVFLRGWLPYRHVAGPGLFETSWNKEQWQQLLLGTAEEQAALLTTLPQPAYVFASPRHTEFYGEYGAGILLHPCMQQTDTPYLYAVQCPSL